MNMITTVAIGTCIGLTAACWGQCDPAWDAAPSSPLGGATAWAPTMHDDGTGPALYVACGAFPGPYSVARWDGTGWSEVGSFEPDDYVDSLTSFEGSLYAAGEFVIGGARTNIARWDGSSWIAMDTGFTSAGTAIRTLTFGGETKLYAGIRFVGVMAWDGLSWELVGDRSATLQVEDLAVFDDGTGEALYAAVNTGTLPPLTPLAKLEGASWTPVGDGVGHTHVIVPSGFALTVFDDGSGSALYIGGLFDFAGGTRTPGIVKWDGAELSALPDGPFPDFISDLEVVDFGTGPELYAGGSFPGAIAKVEPSTGVWTTLGDGLSTTDVQGLVSIDGADGKWLYAAGGFTHAGALPTMAVARWGCADSCPADCDASGDLDFFDFLCFQNLFAAGDPQADCDASTELDFFDFLCFQNEFAAGCP